MMSLVASDTYVKAKSLLDAGDYSGVDLMKEAALAGNPYAQTCYGKILVEGDHVNKDNKKAAELFRKAAEHGIDEAQYYVGMDYYLGLTSKKSYKDALKWFRLSAENGFPKGQYYLGIFYYNGYCVYKDYGFAIRWFTMAANQGYSKARIALADAYMDLHNPNRDIKKAASLYISAAESGDVSAYYKAGMCYYRGKAIKLNYHQAIEYFRLGYKEGDVDCEGVTQDTNIASMMISHAAIAGSDDARAYLDDKVPVKVKHTPMPVEETVLNTPDVVGKIRGADDGKTIFSQLWKRIKTNVH